ncbi:MAG: OmpH family outer membrane protein [Kiritimatiellaeota bacterium]|nr:OmpH family outer membrane protein [Kiritimatiellota bacterium]
MKTNGRRGMVLVGLWLAGAAWGFTAEPRIVFVNMDRAFNEFYKTKLADTQLKEQSSQVLAERKKLTDEYDALQPAFGKLREEAQNPALSEEVRAQKRNAAEEKLVEIRDFESKIKRFDDTRRKQLDDQSRRMRKRLVDEIMETIQIYARNQMFTAVLDTSGQSLNGVQNVLFFDPRVDITADIIGVLNRAQANAGKDVTAPADKPGAGKKPEDKTPAEKPGAGKKPETKGKK